MKNNDNLRGLKSVYSFTLSQTMKSKSNIVSMLILFILSLVSLPLQTFSNSSIAKSAIHSVFITNESDAALDYEALKNENAAFSSVELSDADFDVSSYASHLGENDVYVFIGAPDKKGSYTLESHTANGSALTTDDIEPLLNAISSQMTSAKLSAAGLSSQASYQIDSMSSSDYLAQKTGTKTESIGFDASFAIQYGYSIIVMMLCLLSASFIIRCVITEKESKLIELLMVSVSPLSLLIGKILAVMTYVLILLAMMAVGFGLSYIGSVQFLHMTSLSSLLSQVGIDLSLLRLNPGTIVIALISLMLAFATYAVLSGLIGTCCTSIEQSEPAIMIVTALIMIGYLVSCVAPAISDNRVAAVIFSLCPIINVYCAPVLYVCGTISLVILLISWVIQAVILVAISIFCAKVYRDLLLYRGTRMGFSHMFKIFKNRKKEVTAL